MVVSDESKGKGNSEVLKSLLPEGGISGRPIVLNQDEGIQNTAVEKKPKDITIKLHCLTTNPVILPQLVALVHAPHELVVRDHTGRTWHLLDCAIPILATNCGVSLRMAVGGHHIHQFAVSPHSRYKVAFLPGDRFTSLQVAWMR